MGHQALYATLDDLSAAIEEVGHLPPEYVAKQLHKLPQAPSVDRGPWLCARLAGKTVLHLGAAGPLHEQLARTCTRVFGLDREWMQAPDCYQLDLDLLTQPLPQFPGVEVVLAAEVVEHIGNARFLLEAIRDVYPTQPLVVTTPNAFCAIGRDWIKKGYENVNRDHVAYYSYHTLKTLLAKSGYDAQEWYFYNGPVYFAEGLIVVAMPHDAMSQNQG